MSIILGLHGPALSGKDTFADYLIQEKGWTGKLSFAHNLKEMCKRIFSLTDYDVHDQEGKKALFSEPKVLDHSKLGAVMTWMTRTHSQSRPNPESVSRVKSLIGSEMENPRRVLQLVGTDVCRALIPTYHLDVLAIQIESSAPDSRFIITDVRFPNEGDLIKDDLGGKVVRISRNVEGLGIDRTHPSETSMCDWGRFDYTIDNDEDGLNLFYSKIDVFLERNNYCPTTELL